MQLAETGTTPDLLELNDALDRLAALAPRLARLVEYRFFGGLTKGAADYATVDARRQLFAYYTGRNMPGRAAAYRE